VGRIRIIQTRSGIGHTAVMRRTLRALGLKGYQRSVEHEETPQIRGMIRRVQHLVTVRPADGVAGAKQAPGSVRPTGTRSAAESGEETA